MKNICVVGLGYVGLTFAVHAAMRGFKVLGVEIADNILNGLAKGEATFHEPQLNSQLKTCLANESFKFANKPDEQNFDYIVISVGTPLLAGTKEPNMEFLLTTVESILMNIHDESLIILRSTVNVGMTRKIAQFVESRTGKRVDVAFAPERTAEGVALAELAEVPQIYAGISPSADAKAKNLFAKLSNEIVKVSSLEASELVKLFNNTYRDATFALANCFNLIAQNFGCDGTEIINNSNYRYPRSDIAQPGFVAGPCLEKDAYILANCINDAALKNFIISIREMNQGLEVRFAKSMRSHLSRAVDQSAKILITGMAFKGKPETNDLRGSSSMKILKYLQEFRSSLIVHDFMNSKSELEELTGLQAMEPESLNFQSISKFQRIYILNNHPNYSKEPFREAFIEYVAGGGTLIDVWQTIGIPKSLNISNFELEFAV